MYVAAATFRLGVVIADWNLARNWDLAHFFVAFLGGDRQRRYETSLDANFIALHRMIRNGDTLRGYATSLEPALYPKT
jgi:hypothetical protein